MPVRSFLVNPDDDNYKDVKKALLDLKSALLSMKMIRFDAD